MKPYIPNTKQIVTQEEVIHLLKSEWHLPIHLAKLQRQTLESLGISSTEVNYVLYTIECNYGLELAINEVPLKTTLKQFIQLLLGQRNKANILSF
jgi:hypothetical protein